jgi:hypothetical protein
MFPMQIDNGRDILMDSDAGNVNELGNALLEILSATHPLRTVVLAPCKQTLDSSERANILAGSNRKEFHVSCRERVVGVSSKSTDGAAEKFRDHSKDESPGPDQLRQNPQTPNLQCWRRQNFVKASFTFRHCAYSGQ